GCGSRKYQREGPLPVVQDPRAGAGHQDARRGPGPLRAQDWLRDRRLSPDDEEGTGDIEKGRGGRGIRGRRPDGACRGGPLHREPPRGGGEDAEERGHGGRGERGHREEQVQGAKDQPETVTSALTLVLAPMTLATIAALSTCDARGWLVSTARQLRTV